LTSFSYTLVRRLADLNGNRVGKTLENGTATSYSYDMASRLINVAHTQGATNLATVDYQHAECAKSRRGSAEGNKGERIGKGLGSSIALTDETGAVVESYQYDAFGSVSIYDASNSALSASPRENRFLFTGREWIGEIGLYDYRNRVYSPELGRFLQTDAIRFEAGDVNLYRYVGNGAVDYWDPFGLEWTEKANSITLSGSWTSSSVSYRADGTPAANGYQILHVLGNYEAAASVICVCSETGAEESRTGVRIKTVDFNIGPMLIQVSMDVGSPAIRPPSFRDIMAGIGRIIGGGARTAIPVTPIPNQAQQDRIDGSQRRYTPSSRDLGDGWRGQSPCGG
jgi:RHS repeat-associated protein